MANLELPFGIKVLNPQPADAKYLNNGVPYVDVNEVNSTITSGIRHTGLTVNIAGVEYWYANGIGDGDLVVKSPPISGITQLDNVGIGTGEIVIGVSGDTAEFRTILGSGNTSVSTIGDEVIISSQGDVNEIIITTAATISISATTINATYFASGTTGYTLSSTPSVGTKLTFIDSLGSGLTTPIVVNGNGNVINGFSTATINTDYGSFSLIYNGVNWNIISVVT